MHKIWGDREKQFIRDNADTMKDKDLAVELSKMIGREVSIQAVRKQRQKLGIKKVCGRGLCQVIKKDTNTTNSSYIARTVNRSV